MITYVAIAILVIAFLLFVLILVLYYEENIPFKNFQRYSYSDN